MNFICFLLFFKKAILSDVNTHGDFCTLNHSIDSILKDKKCKDNGEYIQKECIEKMEIEKKCDATVDSDESSIDVGTEEFEIEYLQNVYTTNKELKQDECSGDTATTILQSIKNNVSKDSYENNLTRSSYPELLDLGCKSKNNLVCLRSDALPLDKTVVGNSDKNAYLNLPGTSKDNNTTVVNSCISVAPTQTDGAFENWFLSSCPYCKFSSFATSYDTILHYEEELENLLKKLEKRFKDLIESGNLPEFSNNYILDASKISDNEYFHFKKKFTNFYNRIYRPKKRIVKCVSTIFEQLRHQQIPQRHCILIKNVLNLIWQVFTFISDCKFSEIKKLIKRYYFDDRLKFQKYKFSTLFSDLIFFDMIALIERILYQDQHFDYIKESILIKYLENLKNQIARIFKNYKYFYSDLDSFINFLMKFRKE